MSSPLPSLAPRPRLQPPMPSPGIPGDSARRPVKLRIDGRGAVDAALESKLHPRGLRDSPSKERGLRRRGVSEPREMPRPVAIAVLGSSLLFVGSQKGEVLTSRSGFVDWGEVDLQCNHQSLCPSFSLPMVFSMDVPIPPAHPRLQPLNPPIQPSDFFRERSEEKHDGRNPSHHQP